MNFRGQSIDLLLISLAALSFALALQGCANRLFYYPDRVTYSTPSNYESIYFSSSDATKLHGWFIPATGPAKGTVIHFHGNAKNLSAHYRYVDWLPENGYNLFLFDYRGYGKSEGRPSRKGIYQDSVAALEYILKKYKPDIGPVFVLAQSLGGANAITAIGKNQLGGISGIVIDSTFYSHRSAAKSALSSNPIGSAISVATPVLVSDGFDPGDWVDSIAPIPLVFIHGTNDKVIPVRHTEALFKKAKEPKQFWKIEGGTHTNALSVNREVFAERILLFFDRCLNNPELLGEPIDRLRSTP